MCCSPCWKFPKVKVKIIKDLHLTHVARGRDGKFHAAFTYKEDE